MSAFLDLTIRSPETPEEWQKYFDLCWQVLRQPWNQPPGSERDERENEALHRAAFCGAEIVGAARLQPAMTAEAQIRFMAVAPSFQGRGIGRRLIDSLEMLAREQGIEKVMLDARATAVGFYLVLGYEVVAESHLLFDKIQHYLMEKALY